MSFTIPRLAFAYHSLADLDAAEGPRRGTDFLTTSDRPKLRPFTQTIERDPVGEPEVA